MLLSKLLTPVSAALTYGSIAAFKSGKRAGVPDTSGWALWKKWGQRSVHLKRAIAITRPGGTISYVGVPHGSSQDFNLVWSVYGQYHS